MLSRVHFSALQLILTLSKFYKNLTKWYPWYTFTHMHICRLSSAADKILFRWALGDYKNGIPGTLFIVFRSSDFRGETSTKSLNIQDFYKNLIKLYPCYTFLSIRICQHRCFTRAHLTKFLFFSSRKCCEVLQKIDFRDIALHQVLQIIHFGEPEVRDPLQKIHFRDSQHALPGCVSEFSLNANVVDMCLKLPLAPQVSSTCPQVEHNLAQLALELSSTWLNLVSMWASVHLTCHHLGFVNVFLSPFSFFFCSLFLSLSLSRTGGECLE